VIKRRLDIRFIVLSFLLLSCTSAQGVQIGTDLNTFVSAVCSVAPTVTNYLDKFTRNLNSRDAGIIE
jgi:hypothetical protein